MSEGNGSNAVEARHETTCPVNPALRPEECNTIHTELDGIRRTQKEHGRAIARLSKDVQQATREMNATRGVLEEAVEQVRKLAAAHGMRRKGR